MANSAEVRRKDYLPAAGHDFALPLYDPFTKLMGADKARTVLIEQASLRPGQRILDIGCGTGTLAIRIKRSFPTVDVVGLDPDPKSLARSRRKARHAKADVQFDQGYADRLPYPDTSFERVLSSFMFHHVPSESRADTLKEAFRVLRPGGTLHLLDFSESRSHGHGIMHFFHSHAQLKDNSDERILRLLHDVGFDNSKMVKESRLLLGLFRIAYYYAEKKVCE